MALGEVITYRPLRVRTEATAWLGMVIFLGSWAMMFAGLFFAYGMLRMRALHWPPEGTPTLPVVLPAINTLVIAASSVCLQRALETVRVGRLARVTLLIGAALLLGLTFVLLQLTLWMGLWKAGFVLSTGGTYGSVFYALTFFHAAHVGIGVLALAYLLVRAAQGALNPGRHLVLRLWTAYWHFVGGVWLILFTTLFVL